MQGQEAMAEVRPIREELIARMKDTAPWAEQPSLTQHRLATIGRDRRVADLGISLVADEQALANELSALQTMQASALASLLSPRSVNPAGVAFGAAKGYGAAYRDRLFRAINGVTNASFRFADFNDEWDMARCVPARIAVKS